ncbi:MAG: anthranilate synthase component 1 [Gammaproteobacteria bacterium]|nr:anthranilate synthase component 1 [Gammaproteobacteria bacterium]
MIKNQLVESNCQYSDSPTELFGQLTANKQHVILLESAEVDSKDNLKSLMVLQSALTVTCHGRQVTIKALNENGRVLIPTLTKHFIGVLSAQSDNELVLSYPQPSALLDEDQKLKAISPFSALRELLAILPEQQMLAGTFAYDMVATIEQLPDVPNGDNHCPDYVFYLCQSLLVIDHQSQTAHLTSQIFEPQLSAEINEQHKQLAEQINQFTQYPLNGQAIEQAVSVNISDQQFADQVVTLKKQIVQGNIFQVVPSRAFSLPCPNPLAAYSQLKVTNPSPYMFYVKDSDFILFGASPESALKYDKASNLVEVYPIAGTRGRGFNPDGSINDDLDGRIELDLRLDKKELAEHIMLVDLARNDVARISQPGTRKVAELLKVDRYSHVMHLVSRVTGKLRDDLDALHAYQACMNMGTLVGAPKIKAANLIRQVEQQRRGTYGGAVGYLNTEGDMDSCIIIRSAFVANGKAIIQAGAGVVFDSDPQAETDETRSKAQAVITAIKLAGGVHE